MKLVVLAFEDDAEADKFVRGDYTIHILPLGEWLELAEEVGPEIIGVYKYPTLFCECKPSPNQRQGRKFGWWTCTKCSRAVAGWHPAKNILERTDLKWLQRNMTLTFNARPATPTTTNTISTTPKL